MSGFHKDLIVLLPDLSRFARSLTRNEDDAHDLVQDCVERALKKRALFQDGTSLKSWLFTLMRNLFISQKRRAAVDRKYLAMADEDDWYVQPGNQVAHVLLAETMRALAKLPAHERTVVMVLGLNDADQHAIAAKTGEPVGTLKSRLSRGRGHLRAAMGLPATGYVL
jgi:RNA polymerase sigma-70 factor (ECF subfamily)